MKRKQFLKRLTAIVICAGTVALLSTVSALASNRVEYIDGKVLSFEKDDAFIFSSTEENKLVSEGAATYGRLVVSGDIISVTMKNGAPAYCVGEGNLSLIYSYNDKLLSASEDSWHLVRCKDKSVDTIKIDKSIGKGAIILQSSKDNLNWVNEYISCNVFADTPVQAESFYKTTDAQEVNGCFYRVIIAYETGRKTVNNRVLPDSYEYEKTAEVYHFYVYDKAADLEAPPKNQQHSLGSSVKSNKTYSESTPIGIKDTHYGWQIGNFFVSGFTSKLSEGEHKEQPVFLKNVGDEVALWFSLQQDIDALNGHRKLRIFNNKAGADEYFQIPMTTFGRGTLIIQYTDYDNVKHEPVIYANYLEANAKLGVDTKVQLFEEGDYEIALDYEIANDKLVDTYEHYRMFFKFSVRNSNCMVFIQDAKTGMELTNSSMTSNGFILNLANSRYLTINIKKQVLGDGVEGLVEDTKFNRSAKDGDQYTDEGIYIITVKNRYTEEVTEKRIYVGNNNLLKAYMKTGLSINEIRTKLQQGAYITEDGSITEADAESEPEIIAASKPETVGMPEAGMTESQEKIEDLVSNSVVQDNNFVTDRNAPMMPISIIVVVIIAIGFVGIQLKKHTVASNRKSSNDMQEGEK